MKNIVILGAGWAGLPLAHKLLKYTVPKDPSVLKVFLVSPNSHFFWNVAATRGIIPGEIPEEQLFLPIQPAFAQYPTENFEFVLGSAGGIDLEANAVHVRLSDGQQRSIIFHQLVIATGSKIASNLPFKPLGSHEVTISAWRELQQRIETSKFIAIAGAGATGVEVAGELAAKYTGTKDIALIMAGDKPLSDASSSVRDAIDNDLQKLGIRLVRNAKVTSVRLGEDKKEVLSLSNGSQLIVDTYLPLCGIQVNTGFVPEQLLDSEGNLKLDRYMRVAGTLNIWGIIGDVGNIEPKQLTVTDNQIIHLSGALDAVVTNSAPIKPYKPMDKTMIFLSLGRKFATGQIGNWRLWRFMVAYAKGRKLFVDTAQGYVGGKHLRHAPM